MRTYWLSFCDADRPKGRQFLGVVIVDVSAADADEALAIWNATHVAPMHDQVDGPWIAAAMRACWQAGVNPGGEIASLRIDDIDGFAERSPRYARLRLFTREEVETLGALDDAPTPPAR